MRRALIGAWLLCLGGCGEETPTTDPVEGPSVEAAPEPEIPEAPLRALIADAGFETLAPPEALGPEGLLGRRLFHDVGLSGDATIACATCHQLSHHGAEPRAKSIGIRGRVGELNAPSVVGATALGLHGWRGDVEDVEAMIVRHFEDPLVLDAGEGTATADRLEDRGFEPAFREAFGDPEITRARVRTALEAYLATLATPAAFDRWLEGDDAALDDDAQRGLRLFVGVGCAECHCGPALGGHELRALGVENDYYARRGGHVTASDRGHVDDEAPVPPGEIRFRVAPLRNVTETAPYFHDGSAATLAEAVQTMAFVQLDRTLEDADVDAIVAFLGTLRSDLPRDAYEPGALGAPAPDEVPAETDADDATPPVVPPPRPDAPAPGTEP